MQVEIFNGLKSPFDLISDKCARETAERQSAFLVSSLFKDVETESYSVEGVAGRTSGKTESSGFGR